MAKKLAHLAAQVDGLKSQIKDRVTKKYQLLQRPALFTGQTKTYEPYTQTGERAETIPPETTMVQARVREVLAGIVKDEIELLDKVFQQDVGNTKARADVIVDGVALLKSVPITNLMYLRKRMMEIRSVIQAIPTPDPTVEWVYDANLGLMKSKEEVVTQKTEKRPKVLVKYEATDKHPAQTEVYHVDLPIGEYKKRVFSGAERADVKEEMLARMDRLIDGIKQSIETANITTEVVEDGVAEQLFAFVMEPLTRAYRAQAANTAA
jgi:hypothetical protein